MKATDEPVTAPSFSQSGSLPHREIVMRPHRRLRRGRLWRAWLLAWFGTPVIGIVNGGVRNALVDQRTLRVDQLSTVTLILALGAYMWWFHRRRPLPSTRVAVEVGAVWAALTVAFEFGFGLGVTGDSFADLISAYDFTSGKVWGLVPLWMLVGPSVVRRVSARSDG